MADNTENSFSFGIENTFETGFGDMNILNDLIAPETATAGSEEVTLIQEEIVTPPKPKPAAPKGKEIVPKEEKDLSEQEKLSNFMNDNETEEEEEETIVTKDKEETEPQETQFSLLYKDLKSLGVFDPEEEAAINTPEEFLEAFKNEKKKGGIQWVEDFLSQFGEDYQKAFEAIYVKGVAPKDYFGTYNKIVSFAELDLTQESNQEAVLRQALSDQGFDPEDIVTEIERLKNYGDLEAVSQKHHKVLVKREASKLQQMEKEAEAENARKESYRTQYIQNVQTTLTEKLKTKEFDGIPINPKIVAETTDFLLENKYRLPSGELLTDFDKFILDLKKPENHSQKVKLALIIKTMEKDPSLTTIQRAGASKKADVLFQNVAKQKDNKQSPVHTNSWSQLT